MHIPFKETWLLDVGLVILIITVIFTTMFLLKRLLNIFRKKEKKKYSREGCFGCLLKFLFLNVLLWFSIAMVSLAAFIQSFDTFTKQKLVAQVECEKINFNGYTMRFIITPQYGANAGISKQFYLNGDLWFVEGHILKWGNWLNFLGLHTMYKITRIGGAYWRSEDELSESRTIFSLAKNEIPPTWRWLYKFGGSLPLMQDVYMNRISKPPAYNKLFRIYVATSGFSLETVNKEKVGE